MATNNKRPTYSSPAFDRKLIEPSVFVLNKFSDAERLAHSLGGLKLNIVYEIDGTPLGHYDLPPNYKGIFDHVSIEIDTLDPSPPVYYRPHLYRFPKLCKLHEIRFDTRDYGDLQQGKDDGNVIDSKPTPCPNCQTVDWHICYHMDPNSHVIDNWGKFIKPGANYTIEWFVCSKEYCLITSELKPYQYQIVWPEGG